MEEILFEDLVFIEFRKNRESETRKYVCCKTDNTYKNFVKISTNEAITLNQMESENHYVSLVQCWGFNDLNGYEIRTCDLLNLPIFILDHIKNTRCNQILKKAQNNGRIKIKYLLKIQKWLDQSTEYELKCLKKQQKQRQLDLQEEEKNELINKNIREMYFVDNKQSKDEEKEILEIPNQGIVINKAAVKAEKEVEEVFQKVWEEVNGYDDSISL